jgi:integrase/recombinase XerC
MNHQESFINYLRYEKRSSSHTVLAYQHDLDQFVQFCTDLTGEFDVKSTDRKLIRRWVVQMMEKKLSPRSVQRKVSTLKAFFKYLMKLEVIESNPVFEVPLPKVRKKLPFFVEENNLHHLLDDGFFNPGFAGARDKLVIALLYGTGIRLSELLNLSGYNIDLVQCQIKVTGKRNKQRIVPFSRSLKPEIEEYMKLKNDAFGITSGVLILTDKGAPAYEKLIYRIVKEYLSKVTLLEKRSPHILRHTYATHLLNKGADLNAVKELLGHANLGATEIYTHTTFEKLQNIYQLAHPRG